MHCDHEYLNFTGGKFSKSRSATVDVPYFLSQYDLDPLRFYFTATAPETRDTEFSWKDFRAKQPVCQAENGLAAGTWPRRELTRS